MGADPFGAGLQVLIADWTGPGTPSIRVLRQLQARRQARKAFLLVVVIRLARDLGLRPPEPVDPLPPVEEEEVHLVAWMAVRAGHRTDQG